VLAGFGDEAAIAPRPRKSGIDAKTANHSPQAEVALTIIIDSDGSRTTREFGLVEGDGCCPGVLYFM
jgi:hypothetical protein